MDKLLVSLAVAVMIVTSAFAQDPYAGLREKWLQTAEDAKPELVYKDIAPVAVVQAVQDGSAFQGWKYVESGSPEELYGKNFKEVESVTLDFGKHSVGYFSFHTKTLSRCIDAPVRFKFTFGEVPAELNTPFDPWDKERLGRAWMQDETVTLTRLDEWVTIPRRVAFRYVKIEMMGWPGGGYDFAIDGISFRSQTTAREVKTRLSPDCPERIRRIHDVGIETLRECMQTVYEDGPKRDQRLWIGDLYLEALANSVSFRNFDLTKRCLYLFAALSREDGVLFAPVIEDPVPHPQYGTYIPSYAMLWNVTLADYLSDTGDKATAEDLFPVTKVQIEDGLSFLGDDNLFDVNKKPGWFFIDHRGGLDVSASMQGVLIFALKRTYDLACSLGKEKEVSQYPALIKQLTQAARKELYDRKSGLVLSGPSSQVSIMSQAWMIIAGVLSPKEGAKAIETALQTEECVMPGTPYATHYLLEAILRCGLGSKARAYMEEYWGGMVDKGADTFWEAYDPKDDFYSPYGFHPLNSACHAWSCTPVYFIHKYPEVFQD
ncbi:MAG: glycoside hydrolase [Bacteroidales bacterium]|nr:glycoside hydrolase [Bacteroidales bacterium]